MSYRPESARSRQVKAMQLFYEVKQKFPSVPDHTITSKINTHLQNSLPIDKLLEVMREIVRAEEPMGRAHQKIDSPMLENIQADENGFQLTQTKGESEQKTSDKEDRGEVDEEREKKVLCNSEKNSNLNKDKICLKSQSVLSAKSDQTYFVDKNKIKNKSLDNKPKAKVLKKSGDQNFEPKSNNQEIKFSVNNIDQNINTNDFAHSVKENTMNNNIGEVDATENTKSSNMIQNESEEILNNNCDKDDNISNLETLNLDTKKSDTKPALAKRPNTLDFNSSKSKFKIQPSEKCRDVFTLLNSPNYNEKHPKALISEKPPRSPLGAKRLPRNSPVIQKKETVSTPSQTTDTLVNNIFPSANKVSTPCQTTDTLINNGSSAFSPGVNVSINCEMVQSPVAGGNNNKCSAKLDMIPAQPWLNPSPSWFQSKNGDQTTSPRSFTSVNLTLRPPGSVPQDPIDITSQNSSMTYSTSSFDPQRGLQSRLQITVGPSGVQNVTSVRARPNSSYLPQLEGTSGEVVPARAGSLNNLEDVSPEPPTLLRQQARIDKMHIELRTGYARLVVMRKEVKDLERKRKEDDIKRAQQEMEKQLRMEVEHLKFQVGQLNNVEELFYNNIYTGPNLTDAVARPSRPAPAPPNLRLPVRPAPPAPEAAFGTIPRRLTRGGLQHQGPPIMPFQEIEGPKWNCSMCTFLNHPYLDHCEQCDMPRVLHGNSSTTTDSVAPATGPNPLLSLPGTSRNNGNIAEARNEFASLQTNFNNFSVRNNNYARPSTSKTHDTPNILHSLQEALINTTSLVALKDIQPPDKEKTESLEMLKKSAEVLKSFRNRIGQNESSNHFSSAGGNASNSQGGASFQNLAINTSGV